MRARAMARPRHVPGSMNKLERQFAAELAMRHVAGDIENWRFEAIKLRLAEKTFYTPDFSVVAKGGFVYLYEVKGHWEDDARVKVKVAAEMFPEFHFVGVTFDKRAGWQYEYFNA